VLVRRIGFLLGTLVLAALAGGCLDSKSELVLGMDGKGTWRRTTRVQVDKARAFLEMVMARDTALESHGVEDDPLGIFDLNRRRRALAQTPGIAVVASREATDDTGRVHTTDLAVRFTSMRTLFASEAIEDTEARLEKTEEGHWRLTIRHAYRDRAVVRRNPRLAQRMKALRSTLLAHHEAYWGDLRIEHRLRLPTRVVESNGAVDAAGTGVTWTFGLRELAAPEDLVRSVTFRDDPDLKLEPSPTDPAGAAARAAPAEAPRDGAAAPGDDRDTRAPEKK
jgi:hypothetical protein